MRSERGDGGGVVSPDVYSLGLKKMGRKERGKVGETKATKWCKPQIGGGTRAKRGETEGGKREVTRWERRRERQIKRTG